MEGLDSELGQTAEKEKTSPMKTSPLVRDRSCNSLLSQIRAAGKKSNDKGDEEAEKTYLNQDLDYGLLVNHTPLKAEKTT